MKNNRRERRPLQTNKIKMFFFNFYKIDITVNPIPFKFYIFYFYQLYLLSSFIFYRKALNKLKLKKNWICNFVYLIIVSVLALIKI